MDLGKIFKKEDVPEDDKLLTIKQAAELLQVSKMTLRRWTASGKIAAIIVSKRGDRRFRRSDLDAFMKKGAR